MGAALSQATYPPFIFSLAIGIPSLILYLLEVVILLTKPTHFRSAFFRLFIMRFISNTINYFCSFFFMRLGRLGILFDFFNAMPSSILAFCYFFNFYTFHADNISTMFILLNRLTLIISPMGHETIWKYLLPASIMVIYLTPLSCTVQLFTYDFFVRRQDDNKTFTLAINFKPEKKYIASAYLAAVSAVIFSVLCGMLNLVIVILYRRSRNPQTMARMVEQQVESRLTIYAIVTFIAQLSMALYWLFDIILTDIYFAGSLRLRAILGKNFDEVLTIIQLAFPTHEDPNATPSEDVTEFIFTLPSRGFGDYGRKTDVNADPNTTFSSEPNVVGAIGVKYAHGSICDLVINALKDSSRSPNDALKEVLEKIDKEFHNKFGTQFISSAQKLELGLAYINMGNDFPPTDTPVENGEEPSTYSRKIFATTYCYENLFVELASPRTIFKDYMVHFRHNFHHIRMADKKEQVRFYKHRVKSIRRDGFVYSYSTDLKRNPLWKCRMACGRMFNGKRTCPAYVLTKGNWNKDDRGREFQIGIVMNEHDHEPYQTAFQEESDDDENPEAGLKFYKYIDTKVHRDGYVYGWVANLKSSPPWKQRMTCTRKQRGIRKQCNGYIWTTGEWETDSRERLYQRGIVKGYHACEHPVNEDDTDFVGNGGPMDDEQKDESDESLQENSEASLGPAEDVEHVEQEKSAEKDKAMEESLEAPLGPAGDTAAPSVENEAETKDEAEKDELYIDESDESLQENSEASLGPAEDVEHVEQEKSAEKDKAMEESSEAPGNEGAASPYTTALDLMQKLTLQSPPSSSHTMLSEDENHIIEVRSPGSIAASFLDGESLLDGEQPRRELTEEEKILEERRISILLDEGTSPAEYYNEAVELYLVETDEAFEENSEAPLGPAEDLERVEQEKSAEVDKAMEESSEAPLGPAEDLDSNLEQEGSDGEVQDMEQEDSAEVDKEVRNTTTQLDVTSGSDEWIRLLPESEVRK
ncbi:srg family chemoreceptor domain-containing protein [Ditylenchus destructor]|uniref:Serpentine receptor class gamma n=1 Tax=Ditylenchus destructor TaxID=166010 RepID=A0AAD4MQB0_9BILA|nr:srg family chemoreceptor domain-containing protein [Ditylenchus destructor]